MTTPSPEAIEAAARALYELNPSRTYDEAAGIITGSKPWEWLEPNYQDQKRAEATAALSAAYPLMEAQAKAEAWHEGFMAGTWEEAGKAGTQNMTRVFTTRNPYITEGKES